MLFHSVEKQSDRHNIKSHSQLQNLNTITSSMMKDKSTSELCNSISEFFTMNISETSVTVSIVTQCKITDDLDILENSDLKLMNLETDKQKLKSL